MAFAAVIALAAADPAARAVQDEFYKDRQIRLIISSAPAGV